MSAPVEAPRARTNGHGPARASGASAAERQAAAQDAYRASMAAGVPLSGAELGRQFGRSPQWGRAIVAEVRAEQRHVVDVGRQGDDMAAPAVTPAVRRVTTLAVLAVAVVAAVISYEHMRALAEAAGEGWRSWLVPVSVDGLMVAASMTALTRRRAGQPVGALAWCALLLGIAASVTANVAAADPTVIGRAVASWPPLALGLSFELLLQQGRRQPRPSASR